MKSKLIESIAKASNYLLDEIAWLMREGKERTVGCTVVALTLVCDPRDSSINRSIELMIDSVKWGQAENGSWGGAEVWDTTYALQALLSAGLTNPDNNARFEKGLKWILGQRKTSERSPSYGSFIAQPWETSLVLNLLAEAERPRDANVDAALDYLERSQMQDGSWGLNVADTGLCLRALAKWGTKCVPVNTAVSWLVENHWGQDGFANEEPYERGYAILGLLAAGQDAASSVINNTVKGLLDAQTLRNVAWRDPEDTAIVVRALYGVLVALAGSDNKEVFLDLHRRISMCHAKSR